MSAGTPYTDAEKEESPTGFTTDPDLSPLESPRSTQSSTASTDVTNNDVDTVQRPERLDDDETPEINPELQVMTAKVLRPQAFVRHSEHLRNLPKPTEHKNLRAYKCMELRRWQYGLKHPGLSTFAGIDKNNFTSAVVPGVDWVLNRKTWTVVAPYLVSGSVHKVAFVDADLIRRMNDAEDSQVQKLRLMDLVAVEVTDVFQHGCPAPFVDVSFYEQACLHIKAYLEGDGADPKSWCNIKEMRTDQRVLQDKNNLLIAEKLAKKGGTPKTPTTLPTKPKPKLKYQPKPRTARLKKHLFKRRSEAAKKAAVTRKRKRVETEAEKVKANKASQEMIRQVVAEVQAKMKPPEVPRVDISMVDDLHKKLDNVDRTMRNVAHGLKQTVTALEEKAESNKQVIKDCLKGLQVIQSFVRQASDTLMSGSSRPSGRSEGFAATFPGTMAPMRCEHNNRAVLADAISSLLMQNSSTFRQPSSFFR